MKVTVDSLSLAVIGIIRVGAVFRFIYCTVRLQGAEEDALQYRKRARNVVLFWIIAESVWQIKAIILYYYS